MAQAKPRWSKTSPGIIKSNWVSWLAGKMVIYTGLFHSWYIARLQVQHNGHSLCESTVRIQQYNCHFINDQPECHFDTDLDLDQVLVERVRQTAWEMHYAKTDSIIYLFRWPFVKFDPTLFIGIIMVLHRPGWTVLISFTNNIHTLIWIILIMRLSFWLSFSSSSVLRTWRRAGSWVSTNVSSPTFWWASTGKAAVYDLLRSKPHFRCLSNLSEGTFDFINLAQEVQWCCRSFFSAWQVGDQTANTLLYVFSLFFFYTRHQIWWRRSHWS